MRQNFRKSATRRNQEMREGTCRNVGGLFEDSDLYDHAQAPM